MATIGTDIAQAAQKIKRGELVGIPTDTVYGLACSIQKPEALSRIFKVKNRPLHKPLLIQTDTPEKLKPVVKKLPRVAMAYIEKYWPGALTLIFEANEHAPALIKHKGALGARIPNHAMTLALLNLIDHPLAVTSANITHQPSPTTAQGVEKQIGETIDYILDGGKCAVGVESTIVGFEHEKPILYREGAISRGEILRLFFGR